MGAPRLENRNALITGGASGIGRATALRFAEENANVAVADRDLAAARETANEVMRLGRKAVAIEVDTSDEGQVDAMVARAVSELGGLDILVAAAGVSHARYGQRNEHPLPLAEKPFEDWRKVLSINLDGVFLCDRAVAREMIKAGKGGRIINMASAAAKLPLAGSGEYSVSKAGVWMLSKVLAVELARHHITVNAIGPGFINTPMTAGVLRSKGFAKQLLDQIPLGEMGEPLDVANTALFLACDEGRYYTGSILHPDGGTVMQ